MKQYFLYLMLFLAGRSLLTAATKQPAAVMNPAYLQRAGKIVEILEISDVAKITRMKNAIADHYSNINRIDDALDARIANARQGASSGDQATLDAAIKAARDAAQPELDRVHADFLARLSADLTPAQIEQVKDGLTYGVLPLTFRVYQQMLPDLTTEQKSQILAWLTEAREHAMDAGSADKKHAWFGKYKGKINNYLAKAGYNMKQAEKDLAERNKAAAAKK